MQCNLKSTGIETKERLRLQKTNTLCHTGMLPSSELTNTQHQSIQTEKKIINSFLPHLQLLFYFEENDKINIVPLLRR